MVGCNGYRYPAVLAKIATTVDQVSGGRLEMGLGAGWFELEYNMYGIPFPPPPSASANWTKRARCSSCSGRRSSPISRANTTR